jgi:hypothetical protein
MKRCLASNGITPLHGHRARREHLAARTVALSSFSASPGGVEILKWNPPTISLALNTWTEQRLKANEYLTGEALAPSAPG